MLFGVRVFLICKRRIAARNAIKRDFNQVYGIDYEGDKVECRL